MGRRANNLLASRDVMHLNNLVDPLSGQSWYEAARILDDAREMNLPIDELPPIPFFEHFFPNLPISGCIGPGGPFCLDPNRTATQNVFSLVSRDRFDILRSVGWVNLLNVLDDLGIVPNLFQHPQYVALPAFSSIADSSYHAMLVTIRRRYGNSLNFDLNYSWSKSMDLASGLRTSWGFAPGTLIVNPLNPEQSRARSNFDTNHIVNANWLLNIPVGRGRRYGAGMGRLADALFGGWSFNGILRWNSGRPIGVHPFEITGWSTNWLRQSSAVRRREVQPDPTKNGSAPNLWGDTAEQLYAYRSFRNTYAGEAGDRNVFNRPDFFTLDFGLFKAFRMPYNDSHRIVFRWEVFNATNTQLLDTPGFGGSAVLRDPHLAAAPSEDWGVITSIQGTPRVMQFGLRYEF